MPVVKKPFFVGVCPNCHNMIDVTGEGGYTVFKTREEWHEELKQHGMKSLAEYCGCKRRAARKAGSTKGSA